MWEDILKVDMEEADRFNAKRNAKNYSDEDFLHEVAHQFRYVKKKIETVYYPYYDDDRKDKYRILAKKSYRFLKEKNLKMALKGIRGIKKMVNQFDLPALDYVIEMLEHRINPEGDY